MTHEPKHQAPSTPTTTPAQQADEVEAVARPKETALTSSWKTIITAGIRAKSTDKQTGGTKSGGASTTTTTKGTIVSLQDGPIRLVDKTK